MFIKPLYIPHFYMVLNPGSYTSTTYTYSNIFTNIAIASCFNWCHFISNNEVLKLVQATSVEFNLYYERLSFIEQTMWWEMKNYQLPKTFLFWEMDNYVIYPVKRYKDSLKRTFISYSFNHCQWGNKKLTQ